MGDDWASLYGGYVWVEDGRVVGNVTVQRSDTYARRWQIANVAVAPAHRGQGIAHALMEAALDHIRTHGGTWVVLQVRANNSAARRLYEHLAFEAIAGSSELRRPRSLHGSPLAAEPAPLEPLSPGGWREVYDLATAALPSLAQWWQPLRSQRFDLGIDQRLGEWLSRLIGWGQVWRLGIRRENRLVAAMAVRAMCWQPLHRLEVWVHPDERGKWEAPMVAQALALLASYPAQDVSIQVNTEHTQLIEALQAASFCVHRTLIVMRRRMAETTETT
jgi:GNAT superfamily N-acetyltransferase